MFKGGEVTIEDNSIHFVDVLDILVRYTITTNNHDHTTPAGLERTPATDLYETRSL